MYTKFISKNIQEKLKARELALARRESSLSLKDLSSVERPIHCTNQKKLEFVVKKEDKWDTDKVEVDNVIESITRKRIKILHEWEKENPN